MRRMSSASTSLRSPPICESKLGPEDEARRCPLRGAVAGGEYVDVADTSRTTGRGGAGSVGRELQPVDMSKLDLEEREAHDKFHKEEMKQPIRGGRG